MLFFYKINLFIIQFCHIMTNQEIKIIKNIFIKEMFKELFFIRIHKYCFKHLFFYDIYKVVY